MRISILLCTITLILAAQACNQGGQDTVRQTGSRAHSGVIDIVTTTMDFDAPDTIPSGWITLRYANNSAMVHFALLERMPPGKGLKEHRAEVAPVFQNIMDNINGKEPSAPEAGMDLPQWFGEIQFVSGTGLISPGKTAETIVRVTPGTYLLECYIKTNGIFHSYNPDPEIQPMVHQFTVVDAPSGIASPQPTAEVEISRVGGIEIRTPISAGPQVVGVTFRDQKQYTNFVGHDVHLVQLSDSTDIAALVDWMDWSAPTGMQTPAPAVFLGGTQEMPPGGAGYFRINLQPGEYALIAEVPAADTIGMLQRFTVEEAQ